MKQLLIFAVIVALAGCETIKPAEHGSVIETTVKADGSKVIVENRSDYANYANTKLELAKRPLFTLECPPEGCKFSKLEVANPNAGNDIKEPAPPPKQESAAVGVMREVKETFQALQPVALVSTTAHFMSKVFSVMGGTVNEMAGKIQAPQANVTTTNTSTVTNTNSGNTANTSNTNSGNTTSTSTTTTVTNTGTTGTARIGP